MDKAAIITANKASIFENIKKACEKAGRDPSGVTVIAVTKTVDAGTIALLKAAGMEDVGENRVSIAEEKFPLCPAGIRWHLIGHLQTNKAKKAAKMFDAVHSVDSERVAEALSSEAVKAGRNIEALIQVKTTEEETKSGASSEEAFAVIRKALSLPNLRVTGLMTMGPMTGEPEDARPCFRRLAAMLREAKNGLPVGPEFTKLSMGMTDDYMIALEEGANTLRIGRAFYRGLEPQ